MRVLRVWGNHNPSGIVINPGYYALAACLLCDMSVEEAIAKIMYGQDVGPELKPHKKPSKRSEICKAYKEGMRDYQELAERFDCSKRYVWLALTIKGVVKKNDYYFKICDIMEHEPDTPQKEIALRLGCGLSTVSRLAKRWYREHGIGFLG